jgi:hypothetical protein
LNSSDLIAWFNDSRTAIKNNLSLFSYPIAFVYPWAVSSPRIDAVCLKYYTYCINKTGDFTSENVFNKKEDINNLTIVRVISLGNSTSLSRFKKLFETWNYTVSLNFNENSDKIAYDSSGNGNDGVISGAKWKNDGILKTLKEGKDYTFNEKTGELVPSDEYLYTWFNVTYYAYGNMTEAQNYTTNNTDGEDHNDTINDTDYPRITSTLPIRGFATGNFSVSYIEQNPKELWIIYGNTTDKVVQDVDLSKCWKEPTKTSCNISADLRRFDGQKMGYNFHLADIAGHYNDSKEIKLKVDVSPPVLNKFDYSIGRGMITFAFGVTEPNFNRITYTDTKVGGAIKIGVLCSSLTNGKCTSVKSISRGTHNIKIQILDKAGNSNSFELNVVVLR